MRGWQSVGWAVGTASRYHSLYSRGMCGIFSAVSLRLSPTAGAKSNPSVRFAAVKWIAAFAQISCTSSTDSTGIRQPIDAQNVTKIHVTALIE